MINGTETGYGRAIWGPLGKRKISYAKPVFCTDYYPLSVMSGIYPVPIYTVFHSEIAEVSNVRPLAR
ncbi:hypothetical protein DCL23_16515 [Citrobacter freundii]|nr:hypothetical protein DCL23_16515 [Citrobacter freundii]